MGSSVAGPSLDTKTKRGPLPEKDVVRLGAQLLHALVAAHDQGILHRDLKPQNLKLTPDGLVKVLDFGLARVGPVPRDSQTTNTASGSLAGTPPYMSPEQLLGKDVDARTDVYAAGVVLDEMATGRRPFGETSGPQLVAKILNEPMPPPREANPEALARPRAGHPEGHGQGQRTPPPDGERAARRPRTPRRGDGSGAGQAGDVDGTGRGRSFPAVASPRARGGRAGRCRRRRGVLDAPPRNPAGRRHAHAGPQRGERPRNGRDQRLLHGRVAGADGSSPSPAESRQIPLPWQMEEGVILRGIRHDPPTLLLTRGTELWQLSLREGAAARLARVPPVADAAWSPLGDRLAWVENGGASDSLWVGDATGGGPKRLAETPKGARGGRTLWLTGWHPSGERLRVVTQGRRDGSTSTWRGAPGRRRDSPRDPELWGVGTWTADGALFVHGSRRGVVGYREGDRPTKSGAPVSLGGPTYTIGIRSTPDGRQLVGSVGRFGYEIVRVGEQGVVTPVLAGTQAVQITYSPDGSRAAWLTADSWLGRLWVGRPDGTERLPLGDKPATPGVPLAWSPDGRLIAFTAWEGGSFSWFDVEPLDRRERLYLADPAEGTVEPLTLDLAEDQQFDPCWSADGSWLAYAVDEGVPRDEFYLRRVDLETRRVTRLEGSEGLSWPKCARDGRILARDVFAEQANQSTRDRFLTRRFFFKVRDPATGRWDPLTVDLPPGPRPSGGEETSPGEIAYPTWSHDGRHVYAFQGPQRRVVRFEPKSGRLEIVAAPGGLGDAHGWIGLDPSGAVLMLRDVSQGEIVVMDLEAR